MPFFTQGGKIFAENSKVFITPWKPNRLGGMVFWGDAAQKNISKIGNKVSEWKDISGKRNNAIQNADILRPIVVDNYINNYPSLYFQNSDNIGVSLNLDYFTIFTVIKTSDNDMVYEFGDDTLSDTGFYLNGLTNTLGVSYSGITGSISAKEHDSGWLSSGGTWKIVTHQYNGTHNTNKMYINGYYIPMATYFSYNADPGALNTTEILNIGAKSNGSQGINGYIPEFIVFNRYLDLNDITKVVNYLNTKYQIY